MVEEIPAKDSVMGMKVGPDGYPQVPSLDEINEMDTADMKRLLRTYLQYHYGKNQSSLFECYMLTCSKVSHAGTRRNTYRQL